MCDSCGRPVTGAGLRFVAAELDRGGYLDGHCCAGDAVAWLVAYCHAASSPAPPRLRLVDGELAGSLARHPSGRGRSGGDS